MSEGRTLKQNDSLHLGFSMLADTLNDAGLDQRLVLKPEVSIPWTDDSVKEQLYRPIMKAMTGKVSTTELTTMEISEVWDVLNRHLTEKFGVDFVEFPSLEKLSEGE
jgi:hypothetical protein